MTPCQFARLLKLKYRVVRVWYEDENSISLRTNRDVLITCGLTGKTLLVEKWGEPGRDAPFTPTYFWAMFCDFWRDSLDFFLDPETKTAEIDDPYDFRRIERAVQFLSMLDWNVDLANEIEYVDTSGDG